MKKTLKIASIVLGVAILSLSTMTGCVPDPLPEYESGYFRYAVSTEDDGSKKAYLIGLTELGEQQKILVYPEYIDQIKVYGLGYEIPKLFYNDLIGGFANSQLEKFYFPETPLESVVGNLSLSFPNAYPVWWDSARRNNKILFGKALFLASIIIESISASRFRIAAAISRTCRICTIMRERKMTVIIGWIAMMKRSLRSFRPIRSALGICLAGGTKNPHVSLHGTLKRIRREN